MASVGTALTGGNAALWGQSFCSLGSRPTLRSFVGGFSSLFWICRCHSRERFTRNCSEREERGTRKRALKKAGNCYCIILYCFAHALSTCRHSTTRLRRNRNAKLFTIVTRRDGGCSVNQYYTYIILNNTTLQAHVHPTSCHPQLKKIALKTRIRSVEEDQGVRSLAIL